MTEIAQVLRSAIPFLAIVFFMTASEPSRILAQPAQQQVEKAPDHGTSPSTSGEVQERAVPMPPQAIRQSTGVRVTAPDIAHLPGRTPYLADLTRPGAMYEFDPSAGPLDYSRVVVRTGKGDTPIATLMNGPLRSRITSQWSSTKFRMSHPVGGKIRIPKQSTNFSCQGLECTCTGDSDCNDMFGSGVCGDIAVCNESGCTCLRL